MTAHRFRRPEHEAVAAVLRAMDPALLLECRCFFGGGTAVVLDLGEYRRSKDIDFLCADVDGYRALRSLVVARGRIIHAVADSRRDERRLGCVA